MLWYFYRQSVTGLGASVSCLLKISSNAVTIPSHLERRPVGAVLLAAPEFQSVTGSMGCESAVLCVLHRQTSRSLQTWLPFDPPSCNRPQLNPVTNIFETLHFGCIFFCSNRSVSNSSSSVSMGIPPYRRHSALFSDLLLPSNSVEPFIYTAFFFLSSISFFLPPFLSLPSSLPSSFLSPLALFLCLLQCFCLFVFSFFYIIRMFSSPLECILDLVIHF